MYDCVMTLRQAARLLETCDYPLDSRTLQDAHGEFSIEHPEGSESLGAVLDRAGDSEFADATEAQLALYGAVGEGAIGRKGYSDRDPDPMGTATDAVSF